MSSIINELWHGNIIPQEDISISRQYVKCLPQETIFPTTAPRDQGLTGYNKSWKTPDFAEFCAKKLDE